MNIMIINGPNLDMLGMRQPEIYGKEDYDDLCYQIDEWANDYDISVDVRQSNYEGEYFMWQHSCTGRIDGINGDVDLDVLYLDRIEV